MAAEDELRLDRPVAHLRGWFLRPRVRNSSSACATTAEIVRPDSRACSRTAPASRAGTLTVNTTVASGTGTRPRCRRLIHVPAGLPRRAPEPAGQHPGRLSRRHAPLSQLRSRVDPLSMLAAARAAMDSHAINILPDMSLTGRDTPRPFQPPVAQRDIKAEVIYCVGGVISPCLLNVALHGLEGAAGVRYRTTGVHAGETEPGSPVVIRYADDVAVLCYSQEQARQVKARLAEWLAPRGLSFNEDKTKVVHLTEGFDFLGVSVRRYPGGKLLIKPSKAAIRRLRERLAAETRALRGANAVAVIDRLSPITRGWAAYYRTVVSAEVFSALDHYVFKLTYKWAKYRHPNKPKHWVVGRYFGAFNKFRNDRWVFGDRDSGGHLVKFAWTSISRHVMVKGAASTDDPALADYWASRRRRSKPPLDSYTLSLLTRQDGHCPLCGDHLLTADQPPQSPQQWERWWLQVTRKAIAASYLVHHGRPGPAGHGTTRLVHASCHRGLQARQRGNPAQPTRTPSRLA